MSELPAEIEQEIKAISVPEVRVVTPDGKPTSIDDYDNFMQFLMLCRIASQTGKIRKLEESKVPVKDVLLKLTITDKINKIPISPPWLSFSLLNVGALTVWVNDETDPLVEGMIESGEGYNCNFDYPVIKMIYLKAASGTTAAVRIYGKEGRV